MAQQQIAIVGGGIGGLISALNLMHDFDVTLYESSHEMGGLLRSFSLPNGATYDLGTHILTEITEPTIKSSVFDILSDEDWTRFTDLKAHTYFKRPCTDSPFPDARGLPEPILQKGLAELLEKKPAITFKDTDTLYDYSVHKFGQTFTEYLIAPTIEKQFRTSLDTLRWDSPFGAKRIVCADMVQSRQWKQDPYYDERIAFPSTSEGAQERVMLYPKSQGVSLWVDTLVAKLKAGGVTLNTGISITQVEQHDSGLCLHTKDNQTHSFDKLIWTLPVAPLLPLTGIGFGSLTPPQMNKVKLVHLEFDKPLTGDSHFITNYDNDFDSFRVTLYPNFRAEEHRAIVTVEIITSAQDESTVNIEAICKELIQMNVIDDQAQCVFSETSNAPSGFPVLTPALLEWSALKCGEVNQQFPDILLGGKARGDHFFMQDVIAESFEWKDKIISSAHNSNQTAASA